MEKLKILFIMLVAAAAGLAASLLLLALISSPGVPLPDLVFKIIAEFPPKDIPFFIPLAPLLFLAIILASMVGMIYFLVMPEIKSYRAASQESSWETAAEMVMRTLKPEEQMVVKVLDAHGGKYLQKYISKEAGLSKLKTHRIIARFSERGIVHTTRRGNTNEVSLASWFSSAENGRREAPSS